MPIIIECPECGARNKFPDHLAGKTSRCRSCRERIQVRRRKKGKRSKAKQSNNGLFIGLGVGAFLVIVVAVVFMMMPKGDDEPLLTDSPGNSAKELSSTDPQTDTPVETQETTETPVTSTNPQESVTPPDNSSSPVSQPAQGGGFSNPATSLQTSQLTFQRSQDWSITPDTSDGATEYSLSRQLNIQVDKNDLRGAGVLFPSGISPFFAVRKGSSSKGNKYEIYDATSGRVIGTTPAGTSSAIAAIAPDGSYLALSTSVAAEVEVFDLQANKSLGVLQLSEGERFQISQLAIWKDRLIALSSIQKGFKVWELPSGKLLHHITPGGNFNPNYGHAFSPNGKYLAVDGDFLEKRVELYEILTGQLVGSISPAGKVRVGELEALGFSHDGKQLGIAYGVDIYSSPSRKYSRVVIWDLEPGTIAADFEVEPKLKDQLKPAYQSHTMQSIPGSNRWLVYSHGIVDADAKQLIFSFPIHEEVKLLPSRQVINPQTVLSVRLENGKGVIGQTTFSEEELLAGAASAAAGGIASDAKLPPLTPSDFESAPDARINDAWAAQIDSLSVTELPDQIKISSAGHIRDYVVTRNTAPKFVFRAGVQEDLEDPKIKNYEQSREIFASRGLVLEKPQPIAKESEVIAFDQTGQQIAKLTIPFSTQLHDVSPDGTLALFEEHRTNGRLDIYQLEDDGQHRLAWRPFGGAGKEEHRELKRVHFADNNHVATLNENYQLVVWQLPALKPVWTHTEVLDFTVSPGGKYLAVVEGGILGAKGLAMIESSTGQGVGRAKLEGKVTSLAFHPSGEFLAIGTDSAANKTVSILNVEQGTLIQEIPVAAAVNTIAWTSTDHLLLNGSQLLDRNFEAVVWSYTSPELALPPVQVSEQFSFAALFNNRAVAHAVDLPDDSVAAKMSQQKLEQLAWLKPGDAVQLVVSVPSGQELLPLQSDVEAALKKSLETAGTTVNNSAPIQLQATLFPKNDGTATLSKIGDRSVSETVTRKLIVIEIKYMQGGKTIWQSLRRVSNLDRFLVRLKQGQSAQSAIDEQMVEEAQARLDSMQLPRYIFKESATDGLGRSPLIQ